MNMATTTVRSWINALNANDVETLIELSEPTIAIHGPRGIATGVEVLRTWYTQTHLTFDSMKQFEYDNQVVSLGVAHWHNDDGTEVGKATTAFLMSVSENQRIAELSRYDEGLNAAFAASGVPDPKNWQSVEK